MSILDPNFKYTPAIHTNIRERFDKVRSEINAARQAPEEIGAIKHSAPIDQRRPAVSAPIYLRRKA